MNVPPERIAAITSITEIVFLAWRQGIAES